ncbi:MAG: RNA-guided endonuclease IscB, partial [Acutalibacteraceae bacterium]|nr:RNA-guided endonuclease IscB [Acutalibacteraceae bacterium]
NRKRYRAPRFNNRTHNKSEGWIAPSLKNKADRHIDIIVMYRKVLPVTDVYLEMGSFDTQLLEAIESGTKIPDGTDYQYGPKYGIATLREAVFFRDNYTCLCCGRSAIKNGAILRMHHLGFRKGDHSDRMKNLATVCEKCHTPKNHKPGGKLYNLKPKLRPLTGAAFMNTVRWYIFEEAEKRNADISIHRTYGAMTKTVRNRRYMVKTHANDAYCIGQFRPKHKAPAVSFKKRRRSNRVLEKFRDAKFTDVRDGKTKKAAELSCNRTNRSVPRNNSQNERCFRGQKVSAGKRVIRKTRYAIQPGDVILYSSTKYIAIGVQNNGAYISVHERTPIPTRDAIVLYHAGGWMKYG